MAFIVSTVFLYDLTAEKADCTASEARISSSIMAVAGSSTSGDPAPKEPYLAALAFGGRNVSVAAAVVAAVVRNWRRVCSALSSVAGGLVWFGLVVWFVVWCDVIYDFSISCISIIIITSFCVESIFCILI